VGNFIDEIEAAKAYNIKAIKYGFPEEKLNKIDS
jgi:hypothetical protein